MRTLIQRKLCAPTSAETGRAYLPPVNSRILFGKSCICLRRARCSVRPIADALEKKIMSKLARSALEVICEREGP